MNAIHRWKFKIPIMGHNYKSLYCYLALTLWIFILVTGLYKYMGRETVPNSPKPAITPNVILKMGRHLSVSSTRKRIDRLCNRPENIDVGGEADVNSNYTLEGVLILFRHGDRGPLSHVRNVTTIKCGTRNSTIFVEYATFLKNVTKSAEFLNYLGPFQSFPLIPTSNECSLGQLTHVGIEQLLRSGSALRSAYDKLESSDAVLYSTRYRRTFQSAMALLFAFFGTRMTHVSIQESQSLSFCFDDCACPAIESFRKKFSHGAVQYLKSHPAVNNLVDYLSAIVFETDEKPTPRVLEDALLTFVCHSSSLPCIQSMCVDTEHVNNILAYTEWESKQHVKNRNLVKSFLLQAYGLVRNMVGHLLRMMSDKGPRFVAYSGHDKTLQYLMFALGISDGLLPPYASRLAVELYRHDIASDRLPDKYFFRVIFNGRDLTRQVSFCRKSAFAVDPLFPSLDERRRPHLCRIEAIIRFLHDDYFHLFNGTNFKDVCYSVSVKKPV